MNYHDRFDQVQSIMKTREDNNMTNRTGEVYVENDIELLCPIRTGADSDEKQIGQLRD